MQRSTDRIDTTHVGCLARPEVHPKIVWARREALAEGARRATARLWRAP